MTFGTSWASLLPGLVTIVADTLGSGHNAVVHGHKYVSEHACAVNPYRSLFFKEGHVADTTGQIGPKKMTVGARIQAVRAASGISRRWLADQVEVAYRSLLRYEEGDRDLPAGLVNRIAHELRVDPGWLLTGEGPVPVVLDNAPRRESSDLPRVSDDDTVWIERRAAEPTAGLGGALDDRNVGRYPLLADVAHELGHPRVKLVAVRVRGDSMSPTLRDGDIVVVARDPTAIDDVCVIDVRGELLVKRVHRAIGRSGRIQILSDNNAYPPIEVGPDDDVRVIGRVVMRVQRGIR